MTFYLFLFCFRGITDIFILDVFYRDWSGVFSPPIVLPHELANSTEDFSLSSTSPTKGIYNIILKCLWVESGWPRSVGEGRGVEISDLSTCPQASQNGNFTCPKKKSLAQTFLLNWYYMPYIHCTVEPV